MSDVKAPRDERVLVLAPTARDAALSRALLTEAGLPHHLCTDLCGLCRDLDGGAAAILLTEEVLAAGDPACLVEWLRRQPAWSDLPVLLVADCGADSPVAVWAMELLGNVTALERPVRVTTLVSVLRAALRARRRQYELRNQVAALRASEERFRTLFESMDEGYCVIEVIFDGRDNPTDYRFLEINPAFEKQTGIQDATGRLMRDIAPDHEQHWFDIYGRIVLTGETLRFEKPAAALGRWYDVCAFRVGPPEHRHVGVVFNDITDRKRAESSLRQLAAELSEADRRKDQFLAMLAHELRNPLAPIRNGLQVLRLARQSNRNINGSMVEQAIEIMDKQAHHITRLVDDLLDVSRITRGRIELRKEKVELAAAVSRAVETARPLIESQRHTLTVSLPPRGVRLEADPTRFEQVLVNLLHNAAKYTGHGGHISLTAERDDGHVLIRVRDTGMGISAELLPEVFDLFTQGERTLDRSQGGLGIGLTLVKSLVEMHGGGVEAHSEGAGKGSEFVVRLPALPPEPEQHAAPPEGVAAKQGNGVRVLVVEDAEQAARMLQMLLELWGHEARVVHDGPAAVVACRTYQPDVVLLDIGLPGMDGYDVAVQLRRQQGRKRPLIVALTGYGGEEDRRRAAEAGCDCHLTKPPDPDRLQALLTERAAATASA